MSVSYQYDGYGMLVTGAGSGIGYGIVKAFAGAGARVVLNDVDEALAKKAAAAINREVGAEQVLPLAYDVADPAAVQKATQIVLDTFGRLDVMVANAGITNYGPFLAYAPAAFDRVTGVNLRGTYFSAQAAAKAMIACKTDRGRILMTSSVTGEMAHPNLSAYGMTKAAIIHLASIVAVELGQYGITVNTVCPGATLTERTLQDDPNYAANWQSVVPDGRVGYVEDIAEAALFLASPQARHITGQTLIVDGGWTKTSPIPEDSPDMPEASTTLK